VVVQVLATSYQEREKSLLQDSHQYGKKTIMIVKTPGSQKGSTEAADEEAGGRGGGRGEGGERR